MSAPQGRDGKQDNRSSEARPPRASAQRSRENADPSERVHPLPWFLIMFIGAMGMWGGFYIYSTSSGSSSAYGDQRTASTLRPPEASLTALMAVDGAQIYAGKCASCHQANGAGISGVFPPLAGAEWVTGDEKILSNILLHGVNGPLEVKGNVYNGLMPAWNSLSDEEIAAVLTYIRRNWGNQAPAVTAATVQVQREATKGRTGPYQGGTELAAGN